jgi:hypothetical protein
MPPPLWKDLCDIDGLVPPRKPGGRYAYIAPLYNQAKTVAWDVLKGFARPVLRGSPNEAELRVDLIGGSRISLYGGDNPNVFAASASPSRKIDCGEVRPVTLRSAAQRELPVGLTPARYPLSRTLWVFLFRESLPVIDTPMVVQPFLRTVVLSTLASPVFVRGPIRNMVVPRSVALAGTVQISLREFRERHPGRHAEWCGHEIHGNRRHALGQRAFYR